MTHPLPSISMSEFRQGKNLLAAMGAGQWSLETVSAASPINKRARVRKADQTPLIQGTTGTLPTREAEFIVWAQNHAALLLAFAEFSQQQIDELRRQLAEAQSAAATFLERLGKYEQIQPGQDK